MTKIPLPNEEDIIHFTFSNRYYLTGPIRFLIGIFMVWWPNSKHYTLTNQRIKIRKGVLSRAFDEIELYRIKDIQYSATFFERILSIGNIQIVSTQVSDRHPAYRAIRNAEYIRATIRTYAQVSRGKGRVRELDYFRDPVSTEGADFVDE